MTQFSDAYNGFLANFGTDMPALLLKILQNHRQSPETLTRKGGVSLALVAFLNTKSDELELGENVVLPDRFLPVVKEMGAFFAVDNIPLKAGDHAIAAQILGLQYTYPKERGRVRV